MSETFTPEEQAYFDNAGGDAPATETANPEPVETPEPDEHEEPAEGADTRRQTTVPLGALDKERARRKALETELATLRGEVVGRFTQLESFLRPQQAQQQAPQMPDFQTDPRGHIEARLAITEQITHQMRQQQEQAAAQMQQQQAVQQVIQHASADEARFAKTAPDYAEATTFLKAQREAELRALRYEPAQIAEMVRHETIQLAAGAMQNGHSFAENLYAVAKARGFVPKAGGEDRLDTIARGQQMAAGVGSAGRAPPATMTRERMANMSEAQVARLTPEQRERFLMGE